MTQKYKVMTAQEIQLVRIELCARLPYGVVCKSSVGDYKLLGIDGYDVHLDSPVYDVGDGYFDLEWEEVKPYLRSVSLSNMTMDERYEYGKFVNSNSIFEYKNAADWIRWLNEHHFDYNGLIEKGLALEAPEGMY